jgi:hypothetical protein
LALCCAIAGEFAMYLAGKLVSRPDSITMYVTYHRQNLSSDISALLQFKRTLAFPFGCFDFSLVPEWSVPGKILHYVIRHGVEVRALKIVYNVLNRAACVLISISHVTSGPLLTIIAQIML